MSVLTLSAAVSVSVITRMLLQAYRRTVVQPIGADQACDQPARPGTGCGRPASGTPRPRRRRRALDEALDQAAVQAAHQVGVGLGQLPERAVGEGDRGRRRRRRRRRGRTRAASSRATSAARQRRRRRPSAREPPGLASASPCSRPASAASSAPRPAAPAICSSMRASTGNGGRLEAERRGVGGQRVAVLGPAHRAAGVGSTPSRPTSRMRSRWGRTVLACRPSDSATSAVASGRGDRASSR